MKKISMKKWSGAVAVLVTAFGVATVNANSITTNAVFPTVAEVIAATPDQGGFGQDTAVSLAQSFTVDSAFSVLSIFLEYENDPSALTNHTLTMSIFEVADVQATNLLAGTTLFSDSFTFPAPPSAGSDTIAGIDLAIPLALAPGGYAIQFTDTTAPGWEWLRTTSNTGNDVYAGGKAYQDGVEKSSGSKDFVLALSSMPVPEPTSMALALLGGLVLTLRRRR